MASATKSLPCGVEKSAPWEQMKIVLRLHSNPACSYLDFACPKALIRCGAEHVCRVPASFAGSSTCRHCPRAGPDLGVNVPLFNRADWTQPCNSVLSESVVGELPRRSNTPDESVEFPIVQRMTHFEPLDLPPRSLSRGLRTLVGL